MLKHHLNLAINAYRWTSFDPEKRGKNAVASHSAELASDIETLETLEHVTPEQIEAYKKGYESRFVNLMQAKSRCLSSMITGPARFPVARNEKALNREHAVSTEFYEWREKRLKKLSKPPKEDISDIERYTRDLAVREARQTLMKETNAVFRKWLKSPDKVELTEEQAKAFPMWQPRWSKDTNFFPSFEMTNNNARIKDIRARLERLKANEAKDSKESTVEEMPGLRVVTNFKEDRIQLLFYEIPSKEVRGIVKKYRFNWSPTNKAWQRKLTLNAQCIMKDLISELKGA